MIFHIFLFILFLISLISLGNLFYFVISKTLRVNGPILNNLGLLGFLGIIFLGMSGLVSHFFLPLDSYFLISIIFAFSLIGLFNLIRQRAKLSNLDIGILILVAVILTPLAATMGPGYDAGLYHLPHQLWLRSEPIVVGLANLHGRFGFGSLIEYINAPFWLRGDFTLFSYTQTSVLVFFISFVIGQMTLAKETQKNHLVLLAGIAINIAFFQSYMNPALRYTYTDIPAGIFITSAFLYGYVMVYHASSTSRQEWAIFSLLSMAAVFFKLSSALLIIWYGFVVFYRLFCHKDSFREFMIGATLPCGFLIIWLVRNILSTGCLIYPSSSTCLDLPWSAINNAQNDANWVTAWARHPHSGLSSLKSNKWILDWWLPTYRSFLTTLLISGVITGTFYVICGLRTKCTSLKFNDIRYWAALCFILSSVLFWFWKAPTPRFGIGIFILLSPVIFSAIIPINCDFSNKIQKTIQVIVVVCLIIFACRIGLPWKKINFENAFVFSRRTVGVPAVVDHPVYGVKPKKGDQCWTVPDCSPENRPPKSIILGRSIFYKK